MKPNEDQYHAREHVSQKLTYLDEPSYNASDNPLAYQAPTQDSVAQWA